MKFKLSLLSLCLVLSACSSAPADKSLSPLAENAAYSHSRDPANFKDFVQFLKRKAAGQGVSAATINGQDNILYVAKAVSLDRQQAGRIKQRTPNQVPQANPNGASNYLKRVLTAAKLNKAQQKYAEIRPHLMAAAQRFGVQPEYLLALWGMESSFGYYQGNYDVLSVLATLAFDGRREALFTKEFINAMKMLDRDHINRSAMRGSWAGAMGQTQFMPSSYLNYAADGDNDGEKNIWNNPYDVFASIANYLHKVGWNQHLPWGVEVSLSQPLDLALSGLEPHKGRSLRDWQAKGLILKYQTPQQVDKLKALSSAELWLVRPDREAGRAFLVSANYRSLYDWNRSNYFVLSIGMFADQIKEQVIGK
ncbi:lytic murein transglycosylase [Mesocricetibacter intestinalis]|uniref:lytic murein transglycosylase n=1 Tax=Mesocricetibacter intestinalis TaxID=1521930 RepID=UPI00105B8C84|nr:lytic murein transglycosylase [Mesocricetibacter intestinalis]